MPPVDSGYSKGWLWFDCRASKSGGRTSRKGEGVGSRGEAKWIRLVLSLVKIRIRSRWSRFAMLEPTPAVTRPSFGVVATLPTQGRAKAPRSSIRWRGQGRQITQPGLARALLARV